MKMINQIISATPRTFAIFKKEKSSEIDFDYIEIFAWACIKQHISANVSSDDSDIVIGLSDMSKNGELVSISNFAPMKRFLGYVVRENITRDSLLFTDLPLYIKNQLKIKEIKKIDKE